MSLHFARAQNQLFGKKKNQYREPTVIDAYQGLCKYGIITTVAMWLKIHCTPV